MSNVGGVSPFGMVMLEDFFMELFFLDGRGRGLVHKWR